MNHESQRYLTKDGIRLYEPGDFAGMHAAGRLTAQMFGQVFDDIRNHLNASARS